MRRSPELSERLCVMQVAAVEAAGEGGISWLVEGLWEEEGVGILGGAPKSCKSWLALDLAFSVATGTPALGKYEVKAPGPVLIFAAEDQPQRVRSRLEGFALHRGQDLERIPLHLIVESVLRLDAERDQSRLAETVGRYRPRLLVLDPFVRLHRTPPGRRESCHRDDDSGKRASEPAIPRPTCTTRCRSPGRSVQLVSFCTTRRRGGEAICPRGCVHPA